jgi:hypothetical protein
MVSQEVTIDIRDADEVPKHATDQENEDNTPKARRPATALTTSQRGMGSADSIGKRVEINKGNRDKWQDSGDEAIEMKGFTVKSGLQRRVVVGVLSVEAENVNHIQTFADELFAVCMDDR